MSHTRTHIHAPRHLGDSVADKIATFVGSWLCILLHACWFVWWFVFHLDINLLTNIVSLEAIFLCVILLMAQNRQANKDRARDDLEAEEVQSLTDMNKLQLEILGQQNEMMSQQAASIAQQAEILHLLRDSTAKRRTASKKETVG